MNVYPISHLNDAFMESFNQVTIGHRALVRFSSGKEELSATTLTSLGIQMVEVSKGVIDCCWITIVQALFCLTKPSCRYDAAGRAIAAM